MECKKLMTVIGQYRSIQCIYPYIVPFLRKLELRVAERARFKYEGFVRITAEMIADLKVIKAAVKDMGEPMSMDWMARDRKDTDAVVYTDAATTVGVGGFIADEGGKTFKYLWAEDKEWDQRHHPDITYMELFGVVMAAKLWGADFAGTSVLFWCDNWASVAMAIRKVACFHRRDLNDLLRELCSSVMTHGHHYWIEHIPGVKNEIADAISRDEEVTEDMMDRQGLEQLAASHTDCSKVAKELLERTWFKHTHYIQTTRHERECRCGTDINNRSDKTGLIICEKTGAIIDKAADWKRKENNSKRKRRAKRQSARDRAAKKPKLNNK